MASEVPLGLMYDVVSSNMCLVSVDCFSSLICLFVTGT